MLSSIAISDIARNVLLRPDFRRPLFQPVWNRVHRLALWGMNIGPAGRLADSGEEWALNWCAGQTDASQPFVLFDAGANNGHYAVDALRLLGSRLQLHCFEPSSKTFAKLNENLGTKPQARLLPFGLSDDACELKLYSHLGGSAEASLTKRDLSHWGIQQNIVETVELRRLDDYCAVQNIEKIDFLKLDVEGHELKALNGASRMISEKKIRFIQFEFGAPDIESRTFFKDIFHLLNKNFSICRIVYQGLTPIDTYSEFHETFATANFLAIAR